MSHWKILADTEDSYYFLTATVVDWIYVFTGPKYFQIIIDTLKFCQREKSLRIAGYVIMPNHLHLIGAGSKQFPLSGILRDFKQFAAKRIIEELTTDGRLDVLSVFKREAEIDGRGNTHKVWINGNHPILLDRESWFRQKLNYVHNNPVRKGFVEQPEHWLYSSARNYVVNDHSVIRVECI